MDTKRLKRSFIFLIILLAIVISFFTGLVDFIVDYQWFKELGFINTFFVELTAKLQIGIPMFIGLILFTFIYFQLVKKCIIKKYEDQQ